ncbi:hypothetical protein SALBM311S_12412 [Streptomyces alboniger]
MRRWARRSRRSPRRQPVAEKALADGPADKITGLLGGLTAGKGLPGLNNISLG